MSFSLDEITKLITSFSDVSKFTEDINAQKENKAKLLNILILVDYEGYIFLNPYTDESVKL
ncbi:hypothetical protein [Flavobacterium aquidurense]|uniref:Uncharacterized protein n=1 Tax=Flavobacterium aquidurense TaxID=362413 RepID=A0A0N8VNM6_9FLAO|nr:hypothetical protein [Flavobacterium aquidurense]KQB42548.1 hypothetical protein RC62_3555 [Flavobacterium aquidurense]